MNRPPSLTLLLILLPLIAAGTLRAQPGGGAGTLDPLLQKNPAASSGAENEGEIEPLEAPINPSIYRVGPNDLLLLSYIPSDPPTRIRITPDNQVVLPNDMPVINAAGMTLEQLRTKVMTAVRARNTSVRNPSLVLIRPRPVRVRVRGDVLLPGSFTLSAADRVTTAIERANTATETTTSGDQETVTRQTSLLRATGSSVDGYSTASGEQLRTVLVRHIDGTRDEVDLVRYRLLGDDRGNPTLREGDEIIVQSGERGGGVGYVGVSGAVQTPAAIRWRRGDNALMLARLATGVRENGDPQRAELVRLGAAGTFTRTTIDFDDSASLAALQLQPGDQIVVPARVEIAPGVRAVGIATISGEVQSPGAYPITPGTTKLSELLRQAGGPTPGAALAAAVVERDLPEQRNPVVQRGTPDVFPNAYYTSSITLDDTSRTSRILVNQSGRVSADLESIVRGDTARDVILENGDRILIPTAPRYITVRGRVRFPGAVQYVAGAMPSYYIDRVGGVTDAADESVIGVFRYGADMWERLGDATIRPGDEIYVPGERDEPVRTSLEIAGTYISIISSIIQLGFTVYGFVNSLGN